MNPLPAAESVTRKSFVTPANTKDAKWPIFFYQMDNTPRITPSNSDNSSGNDTTMKDEVNHALAQSKPQFTNAEICFPTTNLAQDIEFFKQKAG